jgi:phosphoribosylamine--glycine ligase
VPKLIEYNVRFGDPECQPIMMRLQGDLVDILHAGATSALNTIQDQVSWSDQTALCVVMAAKGYPGSYEKNTKIENLKEAAQTPNTVIFHAGTKTDDNGDTVSIGGRVLGVTALGNSVEEAQTQAYKATKQITWPQGFYRNDIGWRAVRAEKEKAA